MVLLLVLLTGTVFPVVTPDLETDEEDGDAGSSSWEDYVKAQEVEEKPPCPEKRCPKEEQDRLNGL
jgi:hypothetical protein